ncbi:MAG: hypothetical protein RIR11_4832 [Bacteroidota bacterium]
MIYIICVSVKASTITNVSGKYGFGSPDLIGGNIYQLQGEQTSRTIKVKGNQEHKLLFYVLLDESTTAPSPENVFIYDSNNNLLPIIGESYFKSIFTPIGHDTTNITIIY